MNAGATADRVYEAIKRQLLSGDVSPGEKLDPNRYAEMVSSSVTPVRDAFHRLSGERLVETRPGEGFHAPMVTEPGLRDLYVWNAALLRLLLAGWPGARNNTIRTDLPADLLRTPPALFSVFAARAANDEFSIQLAATNDRLAPARAAEAKVMDNLEAEARAFAVALDEEERNAILRHVTAYHRRRLRAVPDIVRAMYHRD